MTCSGRKYTQMQSNGCCQSCVHDICAWAQCLPGVFLRCGHTRSVPCHRSASVQKEVMEALPFSGGHPVCVEDAFQTRSVQPNIVIAMAFPAAAAFGCWLTDVGKLRAPQIPRILNFPISAAVRNLILLTTGKIPFAYTYIYMYIHVYIYIHIYIYIYMCVYTYAPVGMLVFELKPLTAIQTLGFSGNFLLLSLSQSRFFLMCQTPKISILHVIGITLIKEPSRLI